MCGKPTACGHHFIPKSASSALRYNPLNMVPVCAGCHLKFHSKHSAEIIGRIIEKRGVDWFKSIQKEKVKIIKTNTEYYKDALCTIESMTK
jgi:5-methylcytosine-specific restriction endonuclease McrA